MFQKQKKEQEQKKIKEIDTLMLKKAKDELDYEKNLLQEKK